MSVILNGSIRYIIYFLIFIAAYLLHGGHLSPLFQPFKILMQAGFYSASVMFLCGTFNPKTAGERSAFYQAGRAGLLLSLIVPVVGGVVHTMGLLTMGEEVVGHSIAISLVGALHAPIMFLAYFKWADPKVGRTSPAFTKQFGDIDFKPNASWRKFLTAIVWINFAIGSIVILVGSVAIGEEVLKDSEAYYRRRSSESSLDAYIAARQLAFMFQQKDGCGSWDITKHRHVVEILAARQQRLMNLNDLGPQFDY